MLRVLPLPLLGIDTSSPMDPAQVDGSPHGEGMSEGGTSQGVRAGGARAEASNRGSPGSSEGLVLRGHTGTIRDLCFPWTDQSYLPVDDHGLQDRNSLSKSDGSVPPWAGGRPSVEGSAASRLLSAGAGDFACRIWDLGGGVTSSGGVGGRGDTLTPLVVFRGHTATVFSCSMLPGGEVSEAWLCRLCFVCDWFVCRVSGWYGVQKKAFDLMEKLGGVYTRARRPCCLVLPDRSRGPADPDLEE